MSKKTIIKVEHHYGWVVIKEKTPYKHIRTTHTFLTDDNHTWEDTGDSIVIRRNKNSPPFHPLTPRWARNDFWFSMPYIKEPK